MIDATITEFLDRSKNQFSLLVSIIKWRKNLIFIECNVDKWKKRINTRSKINKSLFYQGIKIISRPVTH